MKNQKAIGVVEPVESLIHFIRGQRVISDADLARVYGVPTKQLNQAIKRNRERVPDGFAFRLEPQEVAVLGSQSVTSSSYGRIEARASTRPQPGHLPVERENHLPRFEQYQYAGSLGLSRPMTRSRRWRLRTLKLSGAVTLLSLSLGERVGVRASDNTEARFCTLKLKYRCSAQYCHGGRRDCYGYKTTLRTLFACQTK